MWRWLSQWTWVEKKVAALYSLASACITLHSQNIHLMKPCYLTAQEAPKVGFSCYGLKLFTVGKSLLLHQPFLLITSKRSMSYCCLRQYMQYHLHLRNSGKAFEASVIWRWWLLPWKRSVGYEWFSSDLLWQSLSSSSSASQRKLAYEATTWLPTIKIDISASWTKEGRTFFHLGNTKKSNWNVQSSWISRISSDYKL